MPHIKIAPFDTSTLAKRDLEYVDFVGVSTRGDEVIGVNLSQEFTLHIKKRGDFFLIKPDKISRPVNVELIKEAINRLVDDLSLDVIHSNTNISSKKPKPSSQYSKTIDDFVDFDPKGFESVAIEIGFGSGRHLLFRANNSPDRLFIGVEIHTPSIMQVLKQIEIQNLKNIWIVNYDARLLLEMLPSNTLSTIYIHFPVPWDKKPHRRVISPEFLDEALRVLNVGGELELRTDSPNYYSYSLEVFSSPKKVDFRVQKNRDLEVISKYEARWRRQEKDIYTITLTNSITSPKKEPICSFEIGEISLPKVEKLKRSYLLCQEERCIVNIREIFTLSGDRGLLLEVTFGSFDRPEQRYILIETSSKRAKYLPNPPTPTKANCKAHQKLKEILCQM